MRVATNSNSCLVSYPKLQSSLDRRSRRIRFHLGRSTNVGGGAGGGGAVEMGGAGAGVVQE